MPDVTPVYVLMHPPDTVEPAALIVPLFNFHPLNVYPLRDGVAGKTRFPPYVHEPFVTVSPPFSSQFNVIEFPVQCA